MRSTTTALVMLGAAVAAAPASATAPPTYSPTYPPNAALQCKTFAQIYADGKALCENIFSNSFKYVPTTDPAYANAYTMWFFTTENPNNAVSQALMANSNISSSQYPNPDQCYLKVEGYVGTEYEQEFKVDVSPDPNMTECQPYISNACCPAAVVSSPNVINQAYGPQYRWDRCGQLSQSCERFFVQEACFYQCDQSVGYWRMFPPNGYDASNPNANRWEILNMPIKGDYCDAWFEACRYDAFCSDDSGDFFACAHVLEAQQANATASAAPLSGGAIAGIVIACVVLLVLLVLVTVMVHRERRGDPLFGKIDADMRPLNAPQNDSARGREGAAAGPSAAAPQFNMTSV